MYTKNIAFLKLSLRTLALQLLLYNTQSSILKLIGQYDYPNLECHQSLNPETLHMEHQQYLLTYLLTAWCRVLLEKLTGLQLVKKYSILKAFFENTGLTALTV